jgi:hypothetical protein
VGSGILPVVSTIAQTSVDAARTALSTPAKR